VRIEGKRCTGNGTSITGREAEEIGKKGNEGGRGNKKGQEPGLNGREWKNCGKILLLVGFYSETQK